MSVVTDPARAFLGVGWAFPPRLDETGDVATVAYEDDIREALDIILSTAQGERALRPTFGIGLRALTFEPLNTITMALVKHRVEEALVAWEPRIHVKEVKVTTDPAARNRLSIDIRYLVRATNNEFNYVYPFYLLEGERP